MSKIPRVYQQPFGSTGPSGDFGQFGSKAAGSPVNTKDAETIQSLAAFLSGWADAIVSGNVPELEDMNSLFLLIFQQIGYILQTGVPEWDSDTIYYTDSFCQVDGVIYISLTDDNIGNDPETSGANWEVFIDDATLVHITGAETIAGVKTFSSIPVLPASDPTTANQAVRKAYADAMKISQILDYGTSQSSYTTKTPADIKMCYGVVTVTNGTYATISNLPFTSASSYKAFLTKVAADANPNYPLQVSYVSGSTLRIYNPNEVSITVDWQAIGS